MRAAGVELNVDSTGLAVTGFVEVVKHLGTFRRVFRQLRQQALAERPDAVVLIDYPGFNLRFAEAMHAGGIRVVYYVCPQVWAWGRHRIPKLAQVVTKMLAIFPFEPAVFAGTGLDIEFVGHPLVEMIAARRDPALTRDPDLFLLLPGSRRNEVERLLRPMVETAAWLRQRRPGMRFVLPVPNPAIEGHVRAGLDAVRRGRGPAPPDIEIAAGDHPRWFQCADAGLAASGTVTVEAAIYSLPLVSVYRVNAATYWLGRRLVRLPYFTMVNLVAEAPVFSEHLQGEVRAEVLGPAAEAILSGGRRREEVMRGMADAVSRLGGSRPACRRAAEAVLAVAGAR